MYTSHEHDDYMAHSDCGCGNCDEHDDMGYLDEDIYDDPFEVVMYDIDAEPDDLYALIEMLSDSARSWYAKRRLNALSAAGPLSALVAAIIIDSLGRPWDPLLHPRDRFGQFINTGGFVRWLLKGVHLRGRVDRIDSDGNIHVRSFGNKGIPDGTIYRFKPEHSSKLIGIQAPNADLSIVGEHLDADIPDFPEASSTQKRVYNALRSGDMPAADLDKYRSSDDNLPKGSDFASELLDLQERNLISIDAGDNRVRRHDDADLGIINLGDDEIDEIGDDVSPDLEDSPRLTRNQRALLDRLVDADRGEGDGIGRDELDGVDDNDLQALIDADVLDEGEDGRVHLVNPEGGDTPEVNVPEERDIVAEIFDAAEAHSDDPDVQEAFQHYAENLANPGGENNTELPEGLSAAKRRTAEAAANKWWEERNADVPDLDAPEEVIPEEARPNVRDLLNPRNQALADTLASDWLPDEFLESAEGEEYRRALKLYFDAEDLEDAGESDQARFKRQDGDRALRKLNNPPDQETIDGWPEQVRAARDADRDGVNVPDAPESAVDVPEDLPEADIPEADIPEADVPDLDAQRRDLWRQHSERLNEEGLSDNFGDRLEQENRLADELGLSFEDEDAPESWQNLADDLGYRPVELLFEDSNGSLVEALAKNPAEYQQRYENELLQDFVNRPNGEYGPEVTDLRRAGLIEATEDNKNWRVTKAGQERLDVLEPDRFGERSDADRDEADLNQALDERQVAEDADLNVEEVDLPSESELQRDRDNADAARALREDYDNDLRLEAEEGVFRALNDAQDGRISRDDAYEVAALAVREGVLSQDDLDRIQGDVAEERGRRGLRWDQDREIDYVGDDQRAPGAFASPSPKAASDHPRHQRIINQKPVNLDDHKYVSEDGKGVLDRNGNLVELGGWYKSNRGGQGDLNEIVGFYDQDRYPGWVLGRSPDGKAKAIHVHGEGGPGGQGGLNRVAHANIGTAVLEWQAQRRAAGGENLEELDEFKAANIMSDGRPARVGMTVRRKTVRRPQGDGGKFKRDTDGVVARVVMDPKTEDISAYILVPGARNEKALVKVKVSQLVEWDGTPDLPNAPDVSPDIPSPDVPSLPEREWEVHNDAELLGRIQEFGGEVDFVDFANAFQDPGAAHDQIRTLLDNGELDFNPEVVDGRPRLRIADGVGDAVDGPNINLPDGAENDIDAELLNIIDAADGGGIGNVDLIDVDADDAPEKMLALRSLVERRVLQRDTDENGRPSYKRVERGAGPNPFQHDPARGTDAGGVHMEHREAVEALRGGADPRTVRTDNLYTAMHDSGRFDFETLSDDGVGFSEWAIDKDVVGDPVNVNGRLVNQRVYFIKEPNESDARGNWRAEMYAGAISQHVGASDGVDLGANEGRLVHPQTSGASGFHVLADHAAYNFPPGTEFMDLHQMQRSDPDGLAEVAHDRVRLVLYDYLINNSLDRHYKNQMYAILPDGSYRVVIIDNGLGDGELADLKGFDSANYDLGQFINSGGRDFARTRKLLESVGQYNNGLTRDDLRSIVESFSRGYSSLDADQIFTSMQDNYDLNDRDVSSLRLWLDTAQSRVNDLSENTENIVSVLAEAIGI